MTVCVGCMFSIIENRKDLIKDVVISFAHTDVFVTYRIPSRRRSSQRQNEI